ncbi:DNA cytosine methyltransferase, partial [Micromonospora sp. NPDC007230]|uniref:DNA cytosine methyltransferase n=1 Tax=Micromonospora sp. NPDC007230 TaxID=3364237 RepID=UPI0036970FCB
MTRTPTGLDLAVELVLGGQLTWYAETDRHARTVLARHWPGVPNLGDIRTVDWTRIPPVDVLTAGFPCQEADRTTATRKSSPTTVGYGGRSGNARRPAHLVRRNRPTRAHRPRPPLARRAQPRRHP